MIPAPWSSYFSNLVSIYPPALSAQPPLPSKPHFLQNSVQILSLGIRRAATLSPAHLPSLTSSWAPLRSQSRPHSASGVPLLCSCCSSLWNDLLCLDAPKSHSKAQLERSPSCQAFSASGPRRGPFLGFKLGHVFIFYIISVIKHVLGPS